MPTPEFNEAHLQQIHITAAKDTALSAANMPVTLKKFDVPDSIELRELKYLNNPKGLTQHSPGFRTMKGSLDMDLEKSSTIIALIKTAYASRSPIFIHCIEDADAADGGKGFVYECVVGSFPKTLEAGALVSVSVELGINDFEAI
ncbi:hypothetical protein F0U59_23440 [Archangium gephyra]|nr:hypothetical protein F0U59_23440 [Archangium gephyra]